jgi:hypothetical protein
MRGPVARASASAALLCLSLLAAAPASAAAAPAHKHTTLYADDTPDISGVWLMTGGVNWDIDKAPPPFTPEYAAIFNQRRGDVRAGKAVYDPTAACLPPGMPRLIISPYPMEILQTPGRVTMLRELMSQVRRIFTDGRPHPADPDPTFNGHSIGHWEGDVLVVDTVGMRGDSTLDRDGFPHSDQTHSVERYHRLDADTLQVRITLEDPKAFAAPYTVTRSLKRQKDDDILEYVCEENNRNVPTADGRTGFNGR